MPKVHQAGGRVDANVEGGVQGPETIEARHQPLRAERRRDADRERAPGVEYPEVPDGGGEEVEAAGKGGQARLTRVGEEKRLVRTPEQGDPEVVLQGLDPGGSPRLA